MPLVHGERTVWPATFPHWELRRGLILDDYTSPQFDRIIANAERHAEQLAQDPAEVVPRLCAAMYPQSCLEMLESRLEFYATSMPASSYRRTSIDFKMVCTPKLHIDAKVDPDQPDVVQLSSGIVLSIEDAAQALLALWERPFGLDAGPSWTTAIPLRLARRGHVDAFVDYSAAFSSLQETFRGPPTGRGLLWPPEFLHDLFFQVSSNLARQTLADHLSVISLLWVIAHEDAHRYSGHLLALQRVLKLGDGGDLFNELISTSDRERHVRVRRPAELEADTCATMRAVDYYFDSEFLSIITDWMPPEMQAAVRRGRRGSDGLDAAQRLFLMRMMAAAAFLPIAVFDIAFHANPQNVTSDYPPLATRALNVIFTIASRAVDVSLQQPAYRAGQIAISELATFFRLALNDIQNLHIIINICMKGDEAEDLKPLWAAGPELVTALFTAFFAYHGRSHLVGLESGIPADALRTQDDLVVALIRERHAMDLACVETFADARIAVNAGRRDKVLEDISLARRRIDWARDAFDFLGPSHPHLATPPDGSGEIGPPIEAELPGSQDRAGAELGPPADHADLGPCEQELESLLRTYGGLPDLQALAIQEADSYFAQALASDARLRSMGIPDDALRLYNRASLMHARNRLEEAEPLYRHALALCEHEHCADHPDAANILNSLAELLRTTGRPAEAEPLYWRALAINKECNGPRHPSVAIVLNNLGELYRGLGHAKLAEAFYRVALVIDERASGPHHPNVAIRLNNLAQLLQDNDRLEEAESLMRRALSIDEQSHGPIHPDVGGDLNNLADLLRVAGRPEEAQALFLRAVVTFFHLAHDNGPDYPQLDVAISNYVGLLRAMGWSEEEVRAHVEQIGRPFGFSPL